MSLKIPDLNINEFTHGETKSLKDLNFFVSDISINNIAPNRPFRSTCYQIALCTSGYIKGKIEDKEIYYDKHTLAVLTPSTVFEMTEVSEDYRCLTVIFKKNFLVEVLNNIYFLDRFRILNNNGLDYLKLTDLDTEKLTIQIENIRDKMKDEQHLFKNDIIRNLIIILLYETENILISHHNVSYTIEKHLRHDKVISDFHELLRKNFFKERKVQFYANKLALSTHQLTKILLKDTGRSAKKHINEILISQAKSLLRSGRYNITEVATSLHYYNLEEFSRFFKKETGMTPLAYLKKKRSNYNTFT
ncbi:helix-turn-helix domain-containing protein [Winogradskyella psychrotolerans]|uniref:helix-turn-helix domain-containing protein n=1 Tax=Winogradskyella psychrotolerans TaxID=1344585 RepID=UPI001C074D13|nr:AraC family transcriptional regulator [Winogradskyella psychrotolerans]MBU2927279.1 AraC family transcriptional regulator [Winogradskyella psychrotolerans]